MARGKTLQVVFKQNFQNQGMLLPPDLNDLIAQNHPVRVVHAVLEKFQAKDCKSCLLNGVCNTQKGDREIEVSLNNARLKAAAEKRLKSPRGIQKRKQRCFDTEPVFGNIKHNHHFRRFMLRGIEKVTVETGLLALAHNLRKKAA
jgi:hypothetical protein